MSSLECGRARRALDRRFDGEPPSDDEQARLDEHLACCAGCRTLEAELDEVQRRLRAMTPRRLPDDALEAVWDATIRAPRGASVHAGRRGARPAAWRAAAAAVVVLALGGGLLWLGAPGPAGPSDAELRRAVEESRLVLGLTAKAMRRTERMAVRDVLGKDVSGALRRVPVDWPGADGAAGISDGSER